MKIIEKKIMKNIYNYSIQSPVIVIRNAYYSVRISTEEIILHQTALDVLLIISKHTS